MIEDFVQTLVNLMIDAGTDETIKHLKDSCEKQQVEKKIIKYLNQQKKYNGLYSVAEEYDFAGICNYLKENSFQKVLDAISGNDSQRKAARSELYTGAYHAAHAETAQSKEKVRRLVSETVDILREIQHSKILLSDRVMQAEIVDDVNAHTDKAIEAFAKKAQENNQSPFSPENVNKLGSNHEYEKLNTLSKQFQNQLGTQHPLYPYYQFTPSQEYEGNLVSSPLRDDARKKYPPRFVLNGIAKIGDDKINELSPEIIEYANRHQLSISLEIHSATKYLGEEKDPIQTEAESLIGATLIKEPRKFSEPRPYSIRIDNTPIFDYIELGVSEILEDKSVVVTNEKQQSPLINIRLVFNVYAFHLEIIRGIGQFCNQRRYVNTVITGEDDAEVLDAIQSMVANTQADGFILLYSKKDCPVAAYLRSEGLLHVIVGKAAQSANQTIYIDNDNALAGEEATDYLYEMGHRRIAYFGVSNAMLFSAERKRGYQMSLLKHGITPREGDCVEIDTLNDSYEPALKALLTAPDRPTAVLVSDDILAVVLEQFCNKLGLGIPKDLSIVSFNNSLFSRITNPPLTTVDVNPYQLGIEAASQTINHIENPNLLATKIIVPHQLIQRESCCPPPEV